MKSVNIPTAETVNYLGVTISSNLKWNDHILSTCKSAKRKLGLLYRNFHQEDQKTLSHLYKALVLSKRQSFIKLSEVTLLQHHEDLHVTNPFFFQTFHK